MSYATDDLTPLLTPPKQIAAVFGQGRIIGWNPETFENAVEYRGTTLVNLPVLSGTEALTLGEGDVVSIVSQNGSPAILGRIVTPGSANAERAIGFLQTNLAKQVSAAVFAERVHIAEVDDFDGTDSTTFTDLTSTTGPSVTCEISSTGKAVVAAFAAFNGAFILPDSSNEIGGGGSVSFQISGATSRSPDFWQESGVMLGQGGSPGGQVLHIATVGKLWPVTGLNPGTHTFTMKYKRNGGGDGTGEAKFSDRSLVVIAF